MLQKIRKCTVDQGQRQTGDQVWEVFFCELEKFMSFVVAHGVIEGTTCL